MARGNNKRQAGKLNDDFNEDREQARIDAQIRKVENEKWWNDFDKGSLSKEHLARLKDEVLGNGYTHYGLRKSDDPKKWSEQRAHDLFHAERRLEFWDDRIADDKSLNRKTENTPDKKKEIEAEIEYLKALQATLPRQAVSEFGPDYWRDPARMRQARAEYIRDNSRWISKEKQKDAAPTPPNPKGKSGWGAVPKNMLAKFKEQLGDEKPMQTAVDGDVYFFAYGKNGKIDKVVRYNTDSRNVSVLKSVASVDWIK